MSKSTTRTTVTQTPLEIPAALIGTPTIAVASSAGRTGTTSACLAAINDTSVQITVVHGINGLLSISLFIEGNECKALGTTGVVERGDKGILDVTILGKLPLQVFLASAESEVANVYFAWLQVTSSASATATAST